MTNKTAAGCAHDNTQKIAQVLYGVLFFNIFSLEELYTLVQEERLIKWIKFNPGDIIFKQGSFDQHFYIIIQGKVELRKASGHNTERTVSALQAGDVFGEQVVGNPENPRQTSAYVVSNEPALICMIDATLLSTVADTLRVKFMKKFLDLVVEQLQQPDVQLQYYQDILHYAIECGIADTNEYFTYTLETAVSDKNRLTQFIKYTDFLISRKIPAENGCCLLERLLFQATQELEERFQTA